MVFLEIFAATALHEVLENKRTELLDPIAVVFAALSFVINSISVYSISACTWKKEVYSIALRTEAKHISIDVAESATVLLGVIFATVISGIWDVVAALIVLGFIAYNGHQTLLDLKTFILDVSPSKEEIDKIVKVINSIAGPNNAHDRQHKYYSFTSRSIRTDETKTSSKAVLKSRVGLIS